MYAYIHVWMYVYMTVQWKQFKNKLLLSQYVNKIQIKMAHYNQTFIRGIY